MDSYCGDIIESKEQEPGICSSDRGRHVIKKDGQLRACPLVVLSLFVMPDDEKNPSSVTVELSLSTIFCKSLSIKSIPSGEKPLHMCRRIEKHRERGFLCNSLQNLGVFLKIEARNPILGFELKILKHQSIKIELTGLYQQQSRRDHGVGRDAWSRQKMGLFPVNILSNSQISRESVIDKNGAVSQTLKRQYRISRESLRWQEWSHLITHWAL
ncbi:hypothetical protein L2E82_16741 [Cichorium intybus]|uniref:Uncharacterized protein n=1 Tax=Cichorium intybus TaxID=13427 RepID=A0ACB9F6C6_CICIN|nr:hypothetical protein L2E82_16741 [Cichorium intybus]